MYFKDGVVFLIWKNYMVVLGLIINFIIKFVFDNDKSMRFEGEFFRIFKGFL